MRTHSILALSALAAIGQAVLINPSFELPPLPDGGYETSGIFGWSSTNTAGAWNLVGHPGYLSGAPHGTQIGYTWGMGLAQLSTDVLTANMVTLSVMAGLRSDNYSGSFDVELWVGDGVDQGNVVNGTKLASVFADASLIPVGGFKQFDLSYTAAANDPSLGKLLAVRFSSNGNSQINVDDVRLNAVPEPAGALALAGLGLAVALIRRKR